MTWYPTAFLPPQIENSAGVPYSGAVLKCYAAGTNTPIPMATDYLGLTTAASFALNAAGYPTYQGTIIIPHLQQNYKMALYPDQASADANSGAIWTIDNNQIASGTNSPFVQYFDGDGVNGTFTLSQNFGTDPTVLLVFADRAIPSYAANTDFATDTVWTKGAGWTIGAGVATAAGAISTAISQNATLPLVQGQSYTVEFTVTASAGTLTPSVGGNPGTTRGAGTWRETIIAGATQVLAFTGVGFTGTLDNASLKGTAASRRTVNRPDEMTLANNQLTLQNIPPPGTKNVIVFAPSLLIGAASASAAAAAISEANALNYANQAAAAAAGLAGTSTTSLTVGTGTKNFTTQTSKQFSVGSWLIMASAANTSNYMSGQVQSYNPTTGAISIFVPASSNYYGGAGITAADWVIQVSGVAGVAGTVGSGTADMKSQSYAAGVGFTAGTTTQLTLTNTPLPASATALFIVFDGVQQHPSEWGYNVSTGVITFNSAIPLLTKNVYTYWFKDIAVGTPTDGTVTFAKLAASAVASAAQIIAGGANLLVSAAALLTALPTLLRNAIGFGSFFESAETALLTATGVYGPIAHGLSATPKIVAVLLRNKTAEAGYSVGDEIYLGHFDNATSREFHFGANATTVYAQQVGLLEAGNKTTGVGFTPTAANWRVVFRAWS